MIKIKLIAFDLWRTLAYKDIKGHTTSELLKATDCQIDSEKFVKIFENSVQIKKWKSEFAAYSNLCKNMKLKRTCKNVNLLIKIRDKSERKTKLYDHSIPMIKKLKKEGYKIAIISNSSVFAIKHLKNKTKLLKYIDYPIFSFDVGVIKPNPKIFRALLKKAKCKPKEVIMIGDNFKDDVIPAKKMGINAIHYTTYEALKEELKKYGINA